MAIEFNDNIHVKINRPTDFRFGPFESIAQANSLIPIAQRYHGLLFGVYTDPLNIETSDVTYYYYWDGLTDSDIKVFSGSKWTDVGTNIYRNSKVLIGATSFVDIGATLEIHGKVSQYFDDDGLPVQSTFFGYLAGSSDPLTLFPANRNTALGHKALQYNVVGSDNTAVGASSLNLTTGGFNTALGSNAGRNITTGQDNIAIGNSAIAGTLGGGPLTGNSNVIIGNSAGSKLSTGSDNVGVGVQSLNALSTGGRNTALGHLSMRIATTAGDNSAVGFRALNNLISGQFNVAIGRDALSFLSSTNGNIGIGHNAGGSITSMTNSILIGINSTTLGFSQTNQIVIGADAIGNGSNTTTIGNVSTLKTFLRGKLNIGSLESPAVGAVTNIGIDSSGNIVAGNEGVIGAGIGLSLSGSDIKLGDGSTLTYVDTPTVKDFFLYQVGAANITAMYSGFGAVSPTLGEAGFAATNAAGSRGAEIKTEYDSDSPNPLAKIQINSGTGLFNVFTSDQTTGYRVRDDIHQRGLVEHANYSANKTDLSYITPSWIKAQSGYNASVAQYFTHDASGNFEWVNI